MVFQWYLMWVTSMKVTTWCFSGWHAMGGLRETFRGMMVASSPGNIPRNDGSFVSALVCQSHGYHWPIDGGRTKKQQVWQININMCNAMQRYVALFPLKTLKHFLRSVEAAAYSTSGHLAASHYIRFPQRGGATSFTTIIESSRPSDDKEVKSAYWPSKQTIHINRASGLSASTNASPPEDPRMLMQHQALRSQVDGMAMWHTGESCIAPNPKMLTKNL